MTNNLDLTFLGRFDIQIDGKAAVGFRSLKAQALLCYLAVSGRSHSRSTLSALLWGDTPEEQALATLTTFCAGCLTVTRQTIAFDRNSSYALDTERFERAAARLALAPELVELYGDLDHSYDDAGNLLEAVDAKGQRVLFGYDGANRLVSENYLQNAQDSTVEVRYHYDADLSPAYPRAQYTLGRLAWVEDQSGAEFLSYDTRGNVAARIKQVVTADDTWDFVTRMRYDSLDRIVALTYPDGSVIDYQYNSQALLEAIPNFVSGIGYMASDQYASLQTADGITTEHHYDKRQRLTELRMLQTGGQVLQAWGYSLDGTSNITKIDDLRSDRSATDDDSRTFILDDLYRLTSAHYTGSGEQIDYAYDAIGNLVRQSGNVTALNLGELRYGQEGRGGPHALTQVGEATWSYDANGNLTTKPGFSFGWDSLDRLVSVSAPNGVQQSHIFDYSGMRVVKRVTTPAGVQSVLSPDKSFEVRGDELYKYIFAGNIRVAEVRTPFEASGLIQGFASGNNAHTSGAKLASDELDHPPLSESTLMSFATTTVINQATVIQIWLPTIAGQPLAIPEGHVRFYHGDHLASASLVVDEQGEVVERISYYPYGLERSHQQTDESTVAYRFTGQELDSDIGLYDYGARFYNPLVGRFISVDPLYSGQPTKGNKSPQALNLYAYALDNPIRFVDPTGLDGKQIDWQAESTSGSKSYESVQRQSFALGHHVGFTGKAHILKVEGGFGISRDKEGISAGPRVSFTMLQATGTALLGSKNAGVVGEVEVNLNKVSANAGVTNNSLSAAIGASVKEGRVSGGFNLLGLHVGGSFEARLGFKVGASVGQKTGIDGGFFSFSLNIGLAKGGVEPKVIEDPCFNSTASECNEGSREESYAPQEPPLYRDPAAGGQ